MTLIKHISGWICSDKIDERYYGVDLLSVCSREEIDTFLIPASPGNDVAGHGITVLEKSPFWSDLRLF